jgi:hypothetical protein
MPNNYINNNEASDITNNTVNLQTAVHKHRNLVGQQFAMTAVYRMVTTTFILTKK